MKKVFRISIFCGLLAIIVYGIIFAINGNIPQFKEITLWQYPWESGWAQKFPAISLPFAISKAWDILIVPIFAGLIAWLFYYDVRSNGEVAIVSIAMVLSFLCGLLFPLTSSVSIGSSYIYLLKIGVAMSLIIGLMGWSSKTGIIASAGFSLGLCFGYGLSTSLVFALVALVPTFLVIVVPALILVNLAFGAVKVITIIARTKIMQALGAWLTA